jgi:hypothetical protein
MSIEAKRKTTDAILAGIGAVLVIIGAFLPWVKVAFISAAGTDGDGVITLIIAAIAGVLILVRLNNWSAILCLLVCLGGLIISGIAIYDMINIQDKIDSARGQSELASAFLSSARIGEGLYATLAGGVAMVIGGVLGARYSPIAAPAATAPAVIAPESPAQESQAPPDSAAV